MRHLVYDHLARTVAIKRTSLSIPPTLDSLAGDFKKLMDELRPETRKARGQAFGPIAAGQQSRVPENTPAAKGQLDALERYYSDEILEKLNGIVSRLRRWTESVGRSHLTAESSFFLKRRIAVSFMVFTWPVRSSAAPFWRAR
jgi:hypothetical protein